LRKQWEGEGKMRQSDGHDALERVRSMRRARTPAEAKLWQALRGRRLGGAKFRRQVWIGPYIADFFCLEAGLVVELDGSQHADQSRYDEARTAFLASKGLRVLRIWNNDVTGNFDGVLEAIAGAVRLPSPSQPSAGPLPLPQGEG
jgi:very-short-patch-repair endonuclease